MLTGTAKIYEGFLKFGQTKHKCKACDRALNAAELKTYEAYVCSSHIERNKFTSFVVEIAN